MDHLNSIFADTTNAIADTTATGVNSQSPAFGFMIAQMLGVLLIMAIVMYFFLFAIKKVNAKYKYKNKPYGFKLYENFYFSQRQGLSAVVFGNKLYIIGFSTTSVTVIDIIEDPELISKMTSDKKEEKKTFSDVLKKFFIKGR